MPDSKLILFGPPAFFVNDQTVKLRLRKSYALLAYLAVSAQPHTRDHLSTLFWPESSQKSARTNLRRMLYEMGQLVPSGLLETASETVGLSPTAPLWLDVAAFQQGVAEGSNSHAKYENLRAAVELYQADFMAGFNLDNCPEFDEWQFFQREELRQKVAKVLQQLANEDDTQRTFFLNQVPANRRLAQLATSVLNVG